MATRIELDDLPPRYRAQAEAQITAHIKNAPAADAITAAVKAAGRVGRAYDSMGEYEYFTGVVLPQIQSGQIVKATPHVAFALLDAKTYGNIKLPAARYTADYVLQYADGTIEVVEIKSKFVRRKQRDYIYRRRLFIDIIAEPHGWKFTEIITPDTKDDIKKWKELSKGGI